MRYFPYNVKLCRHLRMCEANTLLRAAKIADLLLPFIAEESRMKGRKLKIEC